MPIVFNFGSGQILLFTVEFTLGLILLAAGIIATQKVYKGQRGISELIITASIAAVGFILIATAFAAVMETIGCG
jgi:hypothetical protein